MFQNFNSGAIEVWEWIINFVHILLGKWLLLHAVINHGCKSGPRSYCSMVHYDSIAQVIFCVCPANERWHYIVTSYLIGWVHTQNGSWLHSIIVIIVFTQKWGVWHQKQVSQAGKSNCIPQYSVGWKYLSMPEIPASGAKLLRYHYVDGTIGQTIPV